MLLAALASFPACRHEIDINAGGGGTVSDEPAAATPTKPTFTVSMPTSNLEDVPVLAQMMREVNAGVGRDVFFLAGPSNAPTSVFNWTTDASTLESGICAGSRQPGPPPAITINFSPTYATAHITDLPHIADTPFFAAFVHCLGHGLGLSHTTAPDDVMQPDFTQKKNFAAFWTQLK